MKSRSIPGHKTLAPDRHPVTVYLARLAPGSRRTMRHALDSIAAHVSNGRDDAQSLDWSQLRAPQTHALFAVLRHQAAPATVNKTMSALRGVLKIAWRLGYMPAADYAPAVDLPYLVVPLKTRARPLTQGEMRALFCACACDPTSRGARDMAVMSLLYGSGLRRSEVAALRLADYQPDLQELHVHRGGDRALRTCYIQSTCASILDTWIALRGLEPGALFHPINRGQRILPRALSDQSIYTILVERAKQVGVAYISPHSMRRTFVLDLLLAGADIAMAQAAAGHLHPNTTGRYDNRKVVSKRAPLLDVPHGTVDKRRTAPSRPL